MIIYRNDNLHTSGKCGENVTWELKGSELIIDGTGEMYNYDYGSNQADYDVKYTPWKDLDFNSVTINEGVTRIGDGVFQYKECVQNITIPDSVVSIGDAAFQFTSLDHIYLPSSVKEFGYGVFSYCYNLTSLGGKGSGCAIEYDCKGRIPDIAFNGSEIVSIEFSDEITEIGKESFFACNDLLDVNIPGNIKK
ncbi:leucine-rich repeat domain-containing protein [Anaerofustis butyriciformans]|uniref:leucine-rich repeat domain-containing protein n=1 Tax=Anaerofustis butyriciformans TaxID=3108533 RepID=UPI003F8A6EC0